MGETGQIRRMGAMSLAGSIISAAMGFAFTFIISQGYGAAGAGVVFQAMAVFSITWGLAKLGMDSVSIYLLPRLIADKTPRLGANIRWILAVAIMASLIGLGALLVVRGLMESRGAQQATIAHELAVAVGFVAVMIPAAVLSQVLLSMARGLGNIGAFVALGSIGIPGLRVLLAGIGISVGITPAAMAFAWTLPFPVIAAAAGAVVWREVMKYRATIAEKMNNEYSIFPSQRQRREVLRYGMPRTLAAGVEQLNQWLDVLIVGAIAGVASSGVYGGVMRMMVAGLLVDNALRAVVSPIYSSLLHRGKMEELTTIFRQTTQWLVVSSNAIYLTMAVFAPVVLSWLGPEFIQGQWALIVVCVASSVILTFGNVHSLLLMSGRSGLAAMNKLFALVVGIGLMSVLLPIWGVLGAAIGRAAGMGLDALLAAIQVGRLTKIQLVNRQIWWVYGVSAALVVLPQLAVRSLMGPTLAGLVCAIAVSGVLLGLWWWRRHKKSGLPMPGKSA